MSFGSSKNSPETGFFSSWLKKLSGADPTKQKEWVDKILPEIIGKVKEEGGVLIYEDEASFQVSGTIARG